MALRQGVGGKAPNVLSCREATKPQSGAKRPLTVDACGHQWIGTVNSLLFPCCDQDAKQIAAYWEGLSSQNIAAAQVICLRGGFFGEDGVGYSSASA